MSDRYAAFTRSLVGRRVASTVGLPQPVALERWTPDAPAIAGPVLLLTGTDGVPAGSTPPLAAGPAAAVITAAGAALQVIAADGAEALARQHATTPPTRWNDADPALGGIVLDATAIDSTEGLVALHRGLHPVAQAVRPSGRIVVIGRDPQTLSDRSAQIAQRALEGFTRALGKELGRGRTVNLVLLGEGGELALEATLRFLLSARSAYVSGQVVRIGKPGAQAGTLVPADWERPLAGQVALVTGAARGIGAAIAEVLHRQGAQIVGLDIPPLAAELDQTLAAFGGEAITLDITGDDAPAQIAEQLHGWHGRADIVVHNAGITQDRTLARMKPERWDKVIAVNLTAPQRITERLLDDGLLSAGSRVVGVSSIAGIAGNNGQTNYATSKAGVIGLVEAFAPGLAAVGGTINAVAPGFIETQMTAAVPFAIREAGRRMNSVSQGGLPVDVAETIAWLASPGSAGINGRVVRVCGQSLLGA